MQYTENYSLKLPGYGDNADVGDLNDNTTAIDALIHANRQIEAPAFSTETAYTAGEMCVYENVLYKFTADKSAGNWDSTKVTATNLADEVTDAAQSGGTTVVANPSAPATEDLNKLQVENTVYGIPDPTVTKTATGNPIEITDGADAPLVKCVTEIQGYQEGSGTPSPDNIRPITAYTEGEIEVRGKNLFDGEFLQGYWQGSDGSFSSSNSWVCTKTKIKCEPNTDYVISADARITRWQAILWYDENDEYISQSSYNVSQNIGCTAKSPANAYYMGIDIAESSYGSGISPSDVTHFQVEKGSTATTYEPYTSTTHTTTYTSAIYRGSEDCVEGEVTTEWDMIDSYAGETLPGEWISDRDEYAPGTTPTTGAQVAYELATPTTSSVTPTNLPIKSLSGYNHIESSTGEMEVEYITQGYQPLVDLIDEAADTKHAYSTTEHVVGKWVDGKDVYEKTYTFSSLPAVNDWTAFDEDCGIDTLVDYSLMYTRQNGQVDNNTDMLRVAYNPPTGLGDLCYYPGGVGATHITVRYTKSTATTRSLSKGATDSLRADLSEVKDESEEVTEKDEEPVEKVEEPVEEPTEKEENAGESNSENER